MSIENCSDSPDALLSLIESVKVCYQEPPDAVTSVRQPVELLLQLHTRVSVFRTFVLYLT